MRAALLALLPLWWSCAANEAPVAVEPVDPAVLFEHSTFPDAALEREIRQVLDRPRGPLTDAELGTITTLDAGRLNIADLSGIERLANLEILRLGANTFTDLTPLQALERLTDLVDVELWIEGL